MGLVTDLLIWTDCPYRAPKGIEIRRGKPDDCDGEIIVLWAPVMQKHIDFDANMLSKPNFTIACETLKRLIR
jgi:hypothetical protein